MVGFCTLFSEGRERRAQRHSAGWQLTVGLPPLRGHKGQLFSLLSHWLSDLSHKLQGCGVYKAGLFTGSVCVSLLLLSLPFFLSLSLLPFLPLPFPPAPGLPCSPGGPRTPLHRTWHLSLGRPQAGKCSLRKASQRLLRLLSALPHPHIATLMVSKRPPSLG